MSHHSLQDPHSPDSEAAAELAVKSTVLTHSQRKQLYLDAISKPHLDMELVKDLAFSGIPDEIPGLRAKYWKVLLSLLPPDTTLWPTILESKRRLYLDFKNEFIRSEQTLARNTQDHPLSLDENSTWKTYFKDQEILEEIKKDVHRTLPDFHFFRNAAAEHDGADRITHVSHGVEEEEGNTPHYISLRNILFIYAKLNPGIRYVQGMNELLGPIYYIFATDGESGPEEAEADAFFCFTNLMANHMDLFIKTLDRSQTGVTAALDRVMEQLRLLDPHLHRNMTSKGLNPQFFSFRWLTLLMAQDFPLPDVLRLWDSLLSRDDQTQFMTAFADAILIWLRQEIINGDFTQNLMLLQCVSQGSPVPYDIQYLINLAFRIISHAELPEVPFTYTENPSPSSPAPSTPSKPRSRLSFRSSSERKLRS
eukprot:GCRY01005839.1.p1 GENE.GCRY01005839.1~~GCRY01005839.1.p1  ORF type:complete len:422 (-),score=84.33 GCRY01005839.1:474-1739(-)